MKAFRQKVDFMSIRFYPFLHIIYLQLNIFFIFHRKNELF